MKKLFVVLAAVLFLAIMACSGGGGGSSNGGSSGTTTNTAPQIISAPEIFAKADNAYIYKVNAIDNQGDSLSYSLTKAPNGMEINSGTGTVSWVPNASQSGKHDVTVQVSDGKEQATQSFTVAVETSKNLASKFISASVGGQVNATDSAGLISDVQITIPPGVLATDATMFVNKLSNPSYLPDNVPAFEVVAGTSISKAQSAKVMKFKSSAATLPRPIIITVKYSDDILIPFIDETQIEVWTDVSDWGGWTPSELVSRDTIQNIIIAKVDRPFGKIAVGSSLDFVSEQARNFIPYKGSEEAFWKNQGKNLLILHGLGSSSKSFMGTKDFAEYFYNYYDNILFYNYPSFRPIEDNAQALFSEISCYPNVKFDIIAHSMGGLVSRYLIEKNGSRNVDHLFMVGTPNFGALPELALSLLGQLGLIVHIDTSKPGLQELVRLDKAPQFLDRLNPIPNSTKPGGVTNYYWYTGNIGDGTDEFVAVPSLGDLKALGLSDGQNAKTYPYNHTQLHEQCATNGICEEIKKVLTLTAGTLSLSPTSCVIAAGASSCTVSLTWSTTNPVGTSAVTSDYPSEHTQVANVNSGTTTASVPYGGRSFYLYNSNQLLVTSSATATCAAGSTWNDTSCAVANTPGQAPTVQSLSATLVTSTTAQINGSINPNGLSTSAYFEYGTTTSYGSTTGPGTFSGTSAIAIQSGWLGLTPNTTYHYRAVATNSAGTSKGGDVSFTTATSSQAPTVQSLSATLVTSTTAQMNGSVNSNGLSTSAYFEYGTTASYGSTSAQGHFSGNSDSPIGSSCTGLTPNTTYHYRAVATNSAGTSKGDDVSFTTASSSQAPTVQSLAATLVTTTTVQMNGTINPNGLSTSAYFEYGTTASYGSTSAQGHFSGNSSDSPISSICTGLTPNTTYHYRAVATNSAGTSRGGDVSFTTASSSTAPTPTLSSISPNVITQGFGSQTVTFTGTGFTSTSRPYFTTSLGASQFATEAPTNITSTSMTVIVNNTTAQTITWKVCVSNGSSVCSNTQTVTVQPAAPVEIIVDDQGSGFTQYRYHPENAWPEAWIGYNGHMYYVNNTQNVAYDYAIWTPSLSGGAGTYAVYVYVPNNYASTTNAIYTIYHNGTIDVYVVNQSANPNSWALLGSYYFAASGGEYVRLNDLTGETSLSKYVAFDAIMWVKQ